MEIKPQVPGRVVVNVPIKCKMWKGLESFTICDMDDIDVVLGLTFLKSYNRVFPGRKQELVVQNDDKDIVLPLKKSSEAFGGCLNFISTRELKGRCYILVIPSRKAKDGVTDKIELVPKWVEDVLRRYHNVMPEDLPNKLSLREEVDQKIEVTRELNRHQKHHIG